MPAAQTPTHGSTETSRAESGEPVGRRQPACSRSHGRRYANAASAMTAPAKRIESCGATMVRESHLQLRRSLRSVPVHGWALALSAALVVGSANPVLADGRHRQHGAHAHSHSQAAHGRALARRHHGHGHHLAHTAATLLGLAVLSLAAPPPTVVRHWHPRPEPAWVPRYPRVIHAVPQVRQYHRATVPARAPRWRKPVPLPRSCLMIREYQTQVVIDGRATEAYGDACLQADGSWRLGPPKIAPR